MMLEIELLEAQETLSKLLELIENGAVPAITLLRHGKPIACLVPAAAKAGRRLGLLEGKFPSTSQEEFDASNAEVARLFDLT